jgi:hypothetical protein
MREKQMLPTAAGLARQRHYLAVRDLLLGPPSEPIVLRAVEIKYANPGYWPGSNADVGIWPSLPPRGYLLLVGSGGAAATGDYWLLAACRAREYSPAVGRVFDGRVKER